MKLIENKLYDKYKNLIDYKKLSINEDLINDVVLRSSLDKYILLENYAYLFDTETMLDIYYNKYYWYSKLIFDYVNKYKKDDLNLEQGRFKLIEEGGNYPNIDWNEIEEIYNKLKNNE
jgi:hypothetical protein